MRKSSLVPLLFVTAGLLGTSALAFDEFRDFSEGQWQFDNTNTYLTSTSNYPRGGGSAQSLVSGSSYKLLSSELGVRWTFLKNVSVYTELGLGYAQSQTTAQTYTNSGLTYALLGADVLLVDLNGLKVIPEVWGKVPLDNNSTSPNTVEMSESDNEAGARMILRYDRTHWKNFAAIGYDFRDGSRSSLILFGLGTQVEFGRHQLGLSFSGYTSGTPDTNTSQPSLREYAPKTADAGSDIFNTVNPQQTSGMLFYKFNIPMFTFEIGGGTTLTGSNSAAGPFAMLALQYRIGGDADRTSVMVERKSDANLFHEDVKDDVNHDLFSPAKEEPPAAVTPTPPTPPPTRVRPRATPTPDPRSKIDDDLNKTEMQLELKSKNSDN